MKNTTTKVKIINTFLLENKLSPKDLARYLDEEHDFSCYKDTQYDD